MVMVLNGARALGQIRRRHKMASVDAHDPDQPSFVVQRHARLCTVANINAATSATIISQRQSVRGKAC